ncbi:EAL domain-containing protein [Lachnospiraceae bacterium JC7]|nr:EAL domain-containing protein [Lachnospiraceae bacterium JC7]
MRAIRSPKCFLTVFICAIMALGFISEALAADVKKEILRVGVPTDRCPVFYRDPETDEITGIGADLIYAAAENAGYEAEFVQIKEETLKEALDDEEYDIVMPFGSAISSGTGAASIVSENLIQTPFTLVTEGKHRLPPLNGLKVGMLKSLGGAAETVHQLFPGMEITLYADMAQCVHALHEGEVDALLHNSYVWSYVLQKPSYSYLTVQPSAMFSMDFRAGTLDDPKGREIIDRINRGIAGLADTQVQAIVLDHTSRRLYKYDFNDYLYEYGLVLGLTVLLIISLLIILVMKQRAIHLEQEEKMRYLMDHDALTGIWSLNGFRKRVKEILHSNPDTQYFLSYNNIKNFKFINDSFGMAAGDELLRFWADSSVRMLGENEAIGRIDCDHFVVLREIRGEEKLVEDKDKVLDPVRNYFVDRGKDQKVQICSGVYVLTPDDYEKTDVDRMLDFARVAEKRVRESGRNGFEFYNPKQWERGKRIADILTHFPVAIKSGEFKVWYQPQVDYGTGKIIGAEALGRWNHPKLGWISPTEFVPVLEESGYIFELDRFVWEEVCRNLKRWNEEGVKRSVSVNLSRRDILGDVDIIEHFHELIRKYELSPEQLRIEITESAYVEDSELLIQTTKKLESLGFMVEMDDFGSGYSSLHMLKEVPVDRIKLDFQFLHGKGNAEKSRIILRYVIRMIRSLGMKLIAEGVEDAEQADFLDSLGCKEMQGFCFYKPMPVEEFEKLKFKS